MRKRKSPPVIKLHKLPEVIFNKHEWVDFIELMCLLRADQELNQTDIIDRFRRSRELEAPEFEEDDDEGDGTIPEATDRQVQEVQDLFRHVSYRAEAFGLSYPFTISDDGTTLFVRKPLTLRHKSYISLLLSANTGYVLRGRSKLTGSFEIISKAALKQLLPPSSQVHVFGSNSAHRYTRYTGNILTKIRRLAADLHEAPKAKEADFPPNATGDEGLDLVGWVPWGDDAPGRVLFFAQCACSKDEWVAKQHSSSAEGWRNKIDFTVPPANVAFIPVCFRKADGSWHSTADIQSIVVDRLRLLYLLRDRIDIFKRQPSFEVVQAAIRQREPVF